MMKFSIGSFVSGVICGALLAGAWFFNINSDNFQLLTTQPSSVNTSTNTEFESQKSGALPVANQPSGDTVIIESITVPPPGVWVAVREMVGIHLGNVLGATRIDGPRSTISISLLRATEPNRSYAVELYRNDNNDNFDPSINSVYVDFDTGAPVIVYFKTTL